MKWFKSNKNQNERIDWKDISNDLGERYGIIKKFTGSELTIVGERVLLVDLLVEHANEKISRRAKKYLNSGILLFVAGSIMTVVFSIFVMFADGIQNYVELYLPRPVPNRLFTGTHLDFILTLIKRITVSGALLGLIYIIFATANSCFREATILLHRRHAMRYIRLLSYVNNGEVRADDLSKVFGINDVTNTGFERIRTETMRDNLIGKLVEAIGSIYQGSARNKEADTANSKP